MSRTRRSRQTWARRLTSRPRSTRPSSSLAASTSWCVCIFSCYSPVYSITGRFRARALLAPGECAHARVHCTLIPFRDVQFNVGVFFYSRSRRPRALSPRPPVRLRSFAHGYPSPATHEARNAVTIPLRACLVQSEPDARASYAGIMHPEDDSVLNAEERGGSGAAGVRAWQTGVSGGRDGRARRVDAAGGCGGRVRQVGVAGAEGTGAPA